MPSIGRKRAKSLRKAANGLAAAHAAGMVHRDIKPENLMLTKDGIVKVVDFGLSKLIEAADDTRTAVTKAGQILGTPHYMSPEQFESKEIDARADIYGLGATLFRLLTGRYPYHDCPSVVQVMTAHLTKPAPVPTQFCFLDSQGVRSHRRPSHGQKGRRSIFDCHGTCDRASCPDPIARKAA